MVSNSTRLCALLGVLCLFGGVEAQDVGCPPPDSIAPCLCIDLNSTYFQCEGPKVNQSTVDNLFSTLRTLNNISSTEWLSVFSFRIGETLLISLDLSSLYKTRFTELFISVNSHLHSLTSTPSTVPEIDTPLLELTYNNFTDEGLGDIFYRFAPSLKLIRLVANQVQGGQYKIEDGSGDIEFLRGFSQLINLENLYLQQNKIVSLSGGQFKRNGRLQVINLSSNNLAHLGENALLIEPPVDVVDVNREIAFNFNHLTDKNIDPNHGLYSWPKFTTVTFHYYNKMETLTEVNWKRYLESNGRTNKLDFEFIDFHCDKRMQWLQKGRDLYEQQVKNVYCSNDLGNTIFTSSLDFDRPEFACPPAQEIAPCTCTQIHAQSHNLECSGSVTLDDISRLFNVFRSSNDVSPTELLTLASFTVQKTQLTEFDLDPLTHTKINKLSINYNPLLEIILPGSNFAKIEVTNLNLDYNALTDDGLGSSLSRFSDKLTNLNLAHNLFMGGQYEDESGQVEFLRDLSGLKNLQSLILTGNKIKSLEGGQFKRNGKIFMLDLGENEIEELGENSFLIDPSVDLEKDRFIRLASNKLKDEGIHPKNGLDSWTGSVILDVNYNEFDTLSQDNWQGFLFANNHEDVVGFYSNSFQCDQRMKWLKAARDDFEMRVRFVDCVNDPGKNIFNTDLVTVDQ